MCSEIWVALLLNLIVFFLGVLYTPNDDEYHSCPNLYLIQIDLPNLNPGEKYANNSAYIKLFKEARRAVYNGILISTLINGRWHRTGRGWK